LEIEVKGMKLGSIKSFLENKTQNELIIHEYQKLSKGSPCAIKLTLGDVNSWGVDESNDIAVTKAIYEMVERVFLKETFPQEYIYKKHFFSKKLKVSQIEDRYEFARNYLPTHTNGLALHYDKRRAFDNALNELIERHVLMKTLAENISARKIFSQKIENFPTEIEYYVFDTVFHKKVVIAKVDIGENGVLMGTACDSSIDKAIVSARLELYPSLVWAKGKRSYDDEFENENKKAAINFGRSTCWFSKGNEKKSIGPAIKKNDLFFSFPLLDLPKGLREKFVAARVFSPFIQQRVLGKWSNDKMNPAAIEINLFSGEYHVVG
jgi:hypothetical protein